MVDWNFVAGYMYELGLILFDLFAFFNLMKQGKSSWDVDGIRIQGTIFEL
jgi:hypothetical protein